MGLALRFISGKYQGGEFPIVPGKEISIGRSSDREMVLVEDMISRHHARIFSEGDEVFIEDLGSTNGTFVNGEKITRRKLSEGDRVLLGTSILKVIPKDASDPSPQPPAMPKPERKATVARPMSGDIEMIPLPDLLQLLSTSRKSGALIVHSGEGDEGKMFIRDGAIYWGSINDDPDVPGKKAVYRMLRWKTGTFELDPNETFEPEEEIQGTIEGMIMEGIRQVDEWTRIEANAPAMSAKLSIASPLGAALRELSPEELDVFQAVLERGSVAGVLNHYPGDDIEASEKLIELIKRNYIFIS